MKKIIGAVLQLGLFAALLSSVWAQGGQELGTKIAFVNTSAVLQGTAEGKQELSRMEQFVAEKRQNLESQSSELEELRRTYNSQLRMLNPETAAEMQAQIAEKERMVRRLQEDLEIDVNRRQNEMLGRMSEKIQTVIAEYAEENGFGAVFLQTPSLPYFAPALDITATIIRIYDEKHPVAGAAAAAPAANPGQ